MRSDVPPPGSVPPPPSRPPERSGRWRSLPHTKRRLHVVGAAVLALLATVVLIAISVALAERNSEPDSSRVTAERAALERIWSSIDPTTRLDLCNGFNNISAGETVRQFVDLSDGAFDPDVVRSFLGAKC